MKRGRGPGRAAGSVVATNGIEKPSCDVEGEGMGREDAGRGRAMKRNGGEQGRGDGSGSLSRLATYRVARLQKSQRNWQRLAVCLLAVMLLSLWGRFVVLPAIGNYLVVNEPLKNADVVVVLTEGYRDSHVVHAARLVQGGFAPRLLISGCGGGYALVYPYGSGNCEHEGEGEEAVEVMAQAMALGLSREQIWLETESTSTFENGLNTRAVLMREGVDSAVVVASAYHMRRAKLVFDRLFRGTGIDLTYHAAPLPGFEPQRWWQMPLGRELVRVEYSKNLAYRFVYFWPLYGPVHASSLIFAIRV